jgi:hypothetical protein
MSQPSMQPNRNPEENMHNSLRYPLQYLLPYSPALTAGFRSPGAPSLVEWTPYYNYYADPPKLGKY